MSLLCDTAVMLSASVTLPNTKPPKLACAEPQHLPTSRNLSFLGDPGILGAGLCTWGQGSLGMGTGQRVPQIAAESSWD